MATNGCFLDITAGSKRSSSFALAPFVDELAQTKSVIVKNMVIFFPEWRKRVADINQAFFAELSECLSSNQLAGLFGS